MIRFSGNFGQVATWANQLRAVSGSSKELASEFGDIALEQTQKSFDAGKTPNGQTWAALKKGGRCTLVETGALNASLEKYGAGALGFGLRYTDWKAGFHHGGTKGIPKRRLLPLKGFPRKWISLFRKAFNAHMKEALK